MIPYHRRNSLRLEGYDYSHPGEYFITICTRECGCVFGDVADGAIRLTLLGGIVDRCWKEIPEHFPRTRVDTYQIMPNHIHGIVTLKQSVSKLVEVAHPESSLSHETVKDVRTDRTTNPPLSPTELVGGEHPNPPASESSAIQRESCTSHESTKCVQPRRASIKMNRFQHVVPNSLSSIVRSFKAAVTKHARRERVITWKALWQRSFYDHIIRSDVASYFIARYIFLNPLIWHLDNENPCLDSDSIDVFKETVMKNGWFTEEELEYLIQYEIEYRSWRAGWSV